MVKHIPILGANTLPDTSGNVWAEPASVAQTNKVFPYLIYRFKDTATRILLRGKCEVPQDYTGTPVFKVMWTATATTGNVVWEVEYRVVTGTNTTSLDQATVQETVATTVAAPSAAHNQMIATITPTAGNFAAGATVQFSLARNGASASDTMAADALLHGLYLEYS